MPDPGAFSLAGKIVIQFGGTGLLGRALVTALVAAHATLVVASRNRQSLETFAAAEHNLGRDAYVDEVDITSEASLCALRDRVIAQHERIDGIVFNAVARTMRGYAGPLEVAEVGITCNALCPGYVRTPLVEYQIEAQAKAHGLPRERVIKEIILAAQPKRRFVEVEEVAALALFLCREEAKSITGAAIPIDGGWTTR